MMGWKYRSREFLKVIFLSLKKAVKKQTSSAWIFLQPAIQVCRGAYISYFKINAPIFCCPFFFEEYLNPQVRINKMVNEHTADYHSNPSELTSRIHPQIFLWTSKGFISPECFLNFFSSLYDPPWLWESFNLRLLESTFVSQKIGFLLMLPSKTFPQVLIITTQAEGNFLFPPKIYPPLPPYPQESGGRIMELTKWPKLNLQEYWSQVLINSTSFATFTYLICFLCHNLDSSMLKCEGKMNFH